VTVITLHQEPPGGGKVWTESATAESLRLEPIEPCPANKRQEPAERSCHISIVRSNEYAAPPNFSPTIGSQRVGRRLSEVPGSVGSPTPTRGVAMFRDEERRSGESGGSSCISQLNEGAPALNL
jgi:hypothetical protein